MHHANLKHRLTLIATAAAAAALLAVTGCTMVGDRLTGVSFDHGRGASKCLKECNERHQFQMCREHKKHVEGLARCEQASDADKAACKAAENDRHVAALKQIEADHVGCINSCHNQGGHGHGHDDGDDDDDRH